MLKIFKNNLNYYLKKIKLINKKKGVKIEQKVELL